MDTYQTICGMPTTIYNLWTSALNCSKQHGICMKLLEAPKLNTSSTKFNLYELLVHVKIYLVERVMLLCLEAGQ